VQGLYLCPCIYKGTAWAPRTSFSGPHMLHQPLVVGWPPVPEIRPAWVGGVTNLAMVQSLLFWGWNTAWKLRTMTSEQYVDHGVSLELQCFWMFVAIFLGYRFSSLKAGLEQSLDLWGSLWMCFPARKLLQAPYLGMDDPSHEISYVVIFLAPCLLVKFQREGYFFWQLKKCKKKCNLNFAPIPKHPQIIGTIGET